MTSNICNTCGRVFSSKYHLERHNNRMTSCAPILTTQGQHTDKKRCQFCGKTFSTPATKNRHVKKYCKIAPNEKNGEEGLKKLYEYVLNKTQDVTNRANAEKEECLRLINGIRAQGATNPTIVINVNHPIINNTVNNTINNGNTYINNSIHFNTFGREDVSHITKEVVKDLLDRHINPNDIEQSAKTILYEMLKLIYSDPKKPENWTSFALEENKAEVLILSENGWNTENKTSMHTSMTNRALDELFYLQPYIDADKYKSVLETLHAYDKYNPQEIKDVIDTVLKRNREYMLNHRGFLPHPGDPEIISPKSIHTHLPPLKKKWPASLR